MSIKKNLFYNKKEDIIEGYQDHALQGRSPQMATHALVFMIGGIRKKLKQPIAYYFSSGSVTADRLSVLIKEVLQHCFDAGVNISATVCDMDGVNKRALSILGASVEQPYILLNNREVVTIFDTPHLLKCFRNMFLKYDIKCPTNITSNDQIGFGVAKWSHIKEFYETDNTNPNFVFAPCLKQEHLNPNTKQKMKVKLAAQVLSHSVAAGMYAKISQGELSSEAVTTANVIANMDKLFDCVNACTPDLRRGKPYSTNMTNNTPHLTHFTLMKNFFKEMTFLGCKRAPPSQEGWIWSINGIERIWRNLSSKHKSIKSLETRRLQQDPLENLFGCIRANCGCNSNPTAGQFVAGLKTAVLSNLSFIGTGNCEEDQNQVILTNFKSLLSPPTDTHTAYATILTDELEESVNSTFECSLEESSGEIQACAYVCGFIVKNNLNKCEICEKIFVSETQERSHTFINFKEYSDLKKSLKYASKNLINCIESSATMIYDFLEAEAYKKKLKGTIKVLFKNSINWEFLDECPEHKDMNIDYLFNSVFHICMKRFCILKNRQFAEEYSASALKRKIDILQNK
ncbi:unnamed protein product [Parnassius mnemosyne]|uniref:Transposase n=1 Tax=Parnassius mnemosyne TaxID=213953 RepID=A0AAV1LA68_9NEOP